MTKLEYVGIIFIGISYLSVLLWIIGILYGVVFKQFNFEPKLILMIIFIFITSPLFVLFLVTQELYLSLSRLYKLR